MADSKNKTDRKDVYQRITDRVVAGLQQKGLSWFKPWNAGPGVSGADPINWLSRKAYRGVNVLILNGAMEDGGYTHNEWCTYKQAAERKGQVRKGESGTEVIYWVVSFYHKPSDKWYNEHQLKKAGIKRSECDERWSIRAYRVFNIAQIDGLEPRREAPKPAEPLADCEGVWDDVYANYAQGPTLKHGGNKAFYRPATDHVQMPMRSAFLTPDDYAHTLYHELVHSTGHESRLKRTGVAEINAAGDDNYAQEELVAEIGAEYLSTITGVASRPEHSQAYINGWVKQLTDHPKMIVYAAQQATAAVEHIVGK